MASANGIGTIVAGVDGSRHSASALQWAIAMAKRMGVISSEGVKR